MAATPRHRPLIMALIAVAVVFSAGLIGNLATQPNIPTWYATLNKPSFSPPNWVFGPVWGTLYLMMAYSFWRILTLDAANRGKPAAVGWFVGQMVLNGLWSVAFFGLHSPLFGLIVILAMILAILVTLIRFYRLDKAAGLLLVPYLAWVSFASVLNGFVWWLNR